MITLIALFAMVCWGIAPIFGKIGLSNVDPLMGLALRTYLSAALLTGWVIRSGAFTQVKDVPIKSIIYLGIEGLLATLVGDLAYYAAIKHGEISTVTLIMSSSPVISIIIAVILFNESMSFSKLMGTIFIVVGLTLVVR